MDCPKCFDYLGSVKPMRLTETRNRVAHDCDHCGYHWVELTEAGMAAQDRKNAARRAKHAAYRDCGMVRVRGALGGVYYE